MTTAGPRSLATPGFGLDHLPYGSVSVDGAAPCLALRIGDHVVLVGDLLDRDDPGEIRAIGEMENLDPLLAAGPGAWRTLHLLLRDRIASAGAEVPARPLEEVRACMPFSVADYVDFYASEHHASNVGRIFRPEQAPLLPNWKHLPVGYHGRAGTVGIDPGIRRPHGLRSGTESTPVFGPSCRLDIEAEVGFVLGGSAPHGRLSVSEAAERIFGVVLLNDWSARDIQAYEYVPLGPFLGKSFATTIAAWVTPFPALERALVYPPARDTTLADYLDDAAAPPWGLDLRLEVVLNGEVVSRPPFATTYWTAPQMIAHMLVNGASLRPGDLIAGGTVSGPEPGERGSLLELTWAGAQPVVLGDGTSRSFLEDGDTVVLRAVAHGPQGPFLALAECSGRILSSK